MRYLSKSHDKADMRHSSHRLNVLLSIKGFDTMYNREIYELYHHKLR